MTKSENIFVCIGAIHHDYLINLKKNIINYRTNPIIHKTRIGGVAYNVAEIISIFEKVEFYSLKINYELKKLIPKKIKVKQINDKIANKVIEAMKSGTNSFFA